MSNITTTTHPDMPSEGETPWGAVWPGNAYRFRWQVMQGVNAASYDELEAMLLALPEWKMVNITRRGIDGLRDTVQLWDRFDGMLLKRDAAGREISRRPL